MKLLSSIRNFFRSEARRARRNKPGGMAYIRGIPASYGAEEINGHIVRIVRALDGHPFDQWVVDPPQEFTFTSDAYGQSGRVYRAGERVMLPGVEDEFLEPIPGTGVTKEEVAALYASSQIKEGQPA